MDKNKSFDKTSFSFPYKVVDVRQAIDKYMEVKNDYSWSERDKTILLGIIFGCNECEKDSEENILLSAVESATLGLYKKKKRKKK